MGYVIHQMQAALDEARAALAEAQSTFDASEKELRREVR